ncbi:hypothetical protein FL966_01840 [Caproiciproducens galactitolivorans]|nr:hypothetical protein FL966_00980 [Caproiciproducens galactitolivorans]QEY33883.1 hypothetical protein FL966_01840 [Caproiciproducens galactitolivorans]
MGKTNTGLVAFCEQALAAGTGYVYGTIGQVCTKSLLEQCAARYPADNLAGGSMRKLGEKWLGRRVTDCIGLLKYYIMSDGFGKDPHYNSKYDKSANGAYNEATEKGPISTLPEIPGICLHMPGHFGVYIGNGYAIEARGTAYGVVKTKVAGRGWTDWFKSPWIEYVSAKPAFKCDTTCNMAIKHGAFYQMKVTVSGNTPPKVTTGTPDVVTILPRYVVGNDHYFYLCAVGAPKSGTGIYVNGKKQFVVNVK